MIDNAQIHKHALKQLAFYQKVIECRHHHWSEIRRIPCFTWDSGNVCRIMYKCTNCGSVAVETIPWSIEQQLEWEEND